MNETIVKFGYPDTLIAEFDHWVVLLRPDQPALGSLILAAKSDATAFSDCDPAAHAELSHATKAIEGALKAAVNFERINYLMLMMVDPHVHFHVIPRYQGSREAAGINFTDHGWPKVPDLGQAVKLDAELREIIKGQIKAHWP
jgi:diadenosine tetraphosphate (Ap4A) HIT family hydrolase